MKNRGLKKIISLSGVMTAVVVGLVLIILVSVLIFFVQLYDDSIEQNSVISSEQAARQVLNTVENYTGDMADTMELIAEYIVKSGEEKEDF